jgi:hypothetical protein
MVVLNPLWLGPTAALIGAGLGDSTALITDGRFSGASHGFIIGVQRFDMLLFGHVLKWYLKDMSFPKLASEDQSLWLRMATGSL